MMARIVVVVGARPERDPGAESTENDRDYRTYQSKTSRNTIRPSPLAFGTRRRECSVRLLQID
jgi:hypothetical protein